MKRKSFLLDRPYSMAVYVAADVDPYRKSGYMCRVGIDMYSQRCRAAAESARTYTGGIDLL